ncbi:LPD29 domain-containing protein [Paenibacillus sp. 1P03SA]|uniref:LPD29 domain-containing protein n=1 Tax=Paenibacillus sp. 1P03SA TaxID=3132294 RepID=UPI0039A003A2
MTTDMIHLAGKETKKHIKDALKEVFPGVKFSFTSEYNSVTVSWTDGPQKPDVQKVLYRFESYTRVKWKTDYEEPTGYEWKGHTYLGPRYLSVTRVLSDDRKAAIVAYAEQCGSSYADATVFEREEYERELIRKGILNGVFPRNCPDLMRDSFPEVDRREPARPAKTKEIEKVMTDEPPEGKTAMAQVIPFPNQAEKTAVRTFLDSLTAEQQLKFHVLEILYGYDADVFLHSELTVDEAFTKMAEMSLLRGLF